MILGLGSFPSHQTARAASFDCLKAVTARERLVCFDPDLSKLDSQVDQLYRRALTELSPDSYKRLRNDERRWLTYLDEACPLVASASSNNNLSCLLNAYRARIEDLKLAAFRRGPYLFTRVDNYRATMPPAGVTYYLPPGVSPSPVLLHVAYPQLDKPLNVETRKWNKHVVQADPKTSCESPGDLDVGYKVGLATKRLISVTWTDWEYCHGTPHGHGGSHVETVILAPTLRPLQPKDLFRADSSWKTKLTALLRVGVEKQARDDGDADLSHLDVAALANAAASPERWSLKEEGLEVDFDPYELGEGYPFAPQITVPWSALSGVLIAPVA